MRITELIDNILRAAGLFSLIYATLQIILPKTDYESNILIKRIESEGETDNLHYYYNYDDDEIHRERTLFIPQRTRIKKLEVVSLKWDGNKLKKDKVLKTFVNLEPETGVLFNIYYTCGSPTRKIIWTCDYGLKGEHYFAGNGFNGNVNTAIYKYKYSLTNNIRKLLHLK